LARAAAYLWTQQAADGGFHSATYGLLRSGQSLTPFTLDVLLDVPGAIGPPPAGAIERAIAFIRKNTNKDGTLGLMDPAVADYPNYATSLAVIALMKARPTGLENDLKPMIAQLRAQQFREDNGWKPEDPAYGAWGMGGPIHRPPSAGHVDLSMTRFALEALQASGAGASDPAMKRALVYLRRSQNPDGGFYFSAVNTETNKAGGEDGSFLSYGTATADGLLALRAAGVPDSDGRIIKAAAWLKEHHRPDSAPGFAADSPRAAWGSGLRFYYAAAVSRAAPDLPLLLPQQNKDGSFRNPNKLVKEDDPLIATPFAIRALLGTVTPPGNQRRWPPIGLSHTGAQQ
jgi:hypothetical protein